MLERGREIEGQSAVENCFQGPVAHPGCSFSSLLVNVKARETESLRKNVPFVWHSKQLPIEAPSRGSCSGTIGREERLAVSVQPRAYPRAEASVPGREPAGHNLLQEVTLLAERNLVVLLCWTVSFTFPELLPRYGEPRKEWLIVTLANLKQAVFCWWTLLDDPVCVPGGAVAHTIRYLSDT